MGRAQNEMNNKNALNEIIKKKLNLNSDEEVKSYNNALKLAAKFLPIKSTDNSFKDKIIALTLHDSTLSYPFLIQPSLTGDILSRAIKSQIHEEIEQINTELDSLRNQKEEKITSLKKSSSSETKLEDALDKQYSSYDNLNRQVEKLNARKAQLEAYAINDKSIALIKELYINKYPTSIVNTKTQIKIFDLKPIEAKFKEELANHIQQLDDNYVQGMYSKFVDKDLEKKMKRADLADRIGCGTSGWFVGIGVVTMVCTLFYQ